MSINNSRKLALAIVLTGSVLAAGQVMAEKKFEFEPIQSTVNSSDWDPAQPWKLPEDYHQRRVSGELDLNIYDYTTWTDKSSGMSEAQSNDWNDMNTVNETGPQAGRFMYRTHEVRGVKTGGAVSVIDLKTGEAKILAQDASWTALDGIRWTPWGTILFSEETGGGRLFEIKLNDDMMTAASVTDRPAVGRVAHEGIEVDSDGNVYVVDEFRGASSSCLDGTVAPCGGGVYKFVPNTYGDLSAGSLYVLGIKSGSRRDGTGQGEWLGPIDPANARVSGSEAGGQSYIRPEDMEIIGHTLYVAVTEGPRDEYGKEYYESRVISVNLKTMKVADFVKPGVNVPHEFGHPGEAGFQTGFDGVDNLAESPDGRLVMIEDNIPSDIWFASTETNEFGASRKVELFASLSDPAAEGTGIYFSPTDPTTLYVNVQHSAANDGDATWAISKEEE